MSKKTNTYNRRSFCKKLAQSTLMGAGLYSTLGTLSVANAMTRQASFTDYKALVCVFLAGGNDAFNTVLPRSTTEYDIYRASRQSLAIEQQDILPITPITGDGSDYGLNPSLTEVQQLFSNGDLALLGNVGTLLTPTTRNDFFNNAVPLPPQLFSHSDQQDFWRSLEVPGNDRTGWAGRVADLLIDTDATVGGISHTKLT